MTTNVNNMPGLGVSAAAAAAAGVDAVSATVLVQACQLEMVNQLQTSVGLRATTLQNLSAQLGLADSLGPKLAALKTQANGASEISLGTDAASSAQMVSDLGKLGLAGGVQTMYPVVTVVDNEDGHPSAHFNLLPASWRQAETSQAGIAKTSNVQLDDDQWNALVSECPDLGQLAADGQRPASVGTVTVTDFQNATITCYIFDAQATPKISSAALDSVIAALPTVTDRLANEVRDAQQATQTSVDDLDRTVEAIDDSGRAGRRDLVRRSDNRSDEDQRSDDRIARQRYEDLHPEGGDDRRPRVPSNPDSRPDSNPAPIPQPTPTPTHA